MKNIPLSCAHTAWFVNACHQSQSSNLQQLLIFLVSVIAESCFPVQFASSDSPFTSLTFRFAGPSCPSLWLSPTGATRELVAKVLGQSVGTCRVTCQHDIVVPILLQLDSGVQLLAEVNVELRLR